MTEPSTPTGSHIASASGQSGEITLRDLTTWMPGLTIHNGDQARTQPQLENDVEWVVTARSSSPMLPRLRGGELVLLPARVVRESAISFDLLLVELAAQPVAGVVTDYSLDARVNARLPILSTASISADLEGELNRLLTQRRNEILRTTSDLERAIADHAAQQSTLATMITSIGEQFNLDITVTDPSGDVLHGTSPDAAPPDANTSSTHPERWLRSPLQGGRTLWVGPLEPERAAMGRHFIRHLTSGVQRAIAQSDANAPHGRARVDALNRLLNASSDTDSERVESLATQAGIPLRSELRVVLMSVSLEDEAIRRHLGQMGTVLDAGQIGTSHAAIVVQATTHVEGAHHPALPAGTWLASSAPVNSSRSLLDAIRQARYIALLLEHGLLAPGGVSFEDDVKLGAYRLLYEHWGSPMLRRYIDSHIGPLLRHDRRGILRETLRVYLEHGGVQQATSERLGIHRNTLRYRLRQIRETLDLDPDDPANRLGLHLALSASTLPDVSAVLSKDDTSATP